MASIRHIIPVVLIVQLTTAVGLTGWLSFANGEKAVNKLAQQLSQDASERIEQHINNYLEKSALINDSTAYVLNKNIVNPDDQLALQKHLWEKIEELKLESHIYYGNERGDFVGVDRYQGETFLRVRNEASAPNRLVFKLNQKGERATTLEPQNYDTVSRPWYVAAKQQGKPIWSPIFISADRSLLTISRATPVFSNTGTFRGAVGINVTLSQISEFLKQQKISKSGEAFIVELSGDVVASSTDEPPFITTKDGKQERVSSVKSSDMLIQSTAQSIIEKFKDFQQVGENQLFKFDLKGSRQLVNVTKLHSKDGLDWLIVVVIPESDFMEEIAASNRNTIVIIIATLVFSIAIGLLMARWLLNPMDRLNKAAKAIEDQEFTDEHLAGLVDRNDEIGQMARVFQRMGNVVFAREKGMKDQMSKLRQESDKAKKAAMAAKMGQTNDLQNLLTKARSVRDGTSTAGNRPNNSGR
ncbi:cache and HAMP domain-containing protein [Tumidithrix elongata RA019]|uniref:histidine kinase n=1 Tax=Tumidithrix elongata BACA0141 TaxID=2716417 RepID=A0AAW9Q4L0_9CYAN|nr:cache and HAMP domain-containing protein [Tumidithrix elongata RA019]